VVARAASAALRRQHGGDGCRAREADIPPRTRSAEWVIHSGPPKWRMAQENHRDAQISDTGLDDLKDFAPHRLDLRNPPAETRTCELHMLRPQSEGHRPGRSLERKRDTPDIHGPVSRLAP
jgi:hypothetical protein